MKLKSELYKKEQEELCDKIIDILKLDKENSITLHDLDNDLEKQQSVMNLIPDIRKYFLINKIAGAKNAVIKRPYLSLIRHVVKVKYNMYNTDFRLVKDDKKIRTTKYIFNLK